jgi:hypothetical protein
MRQQSRRIAQLDELGAASITACKMLIEAARVGHIKPIQRMQSQKVLVFLMLHQI